MDEDRATLDLPLTQTEWGRLARDGIYVSSRYRRTRIEPNWTTEPGRYRWGRGLTASLDDEFDLMNAFIREQADAGDELYQRVLIHLIKQRLLEKRREE